MRQPKKHLKDAYMQLGAVEMLDMSEMLQITLQQADGDLWQQVTEEEMQSSQQLSMNELVDAALGVSKAEQVGAPEQEDSRQGTRPS
jgi:hypothetical protein